jgi:hypothetical protein
MNHQAPTSAERELARLAAEHYGLPESDIPAIIEFERHRATQARIIGMAGLRALPCFIAGYSAGRAAMQTAEPALYDAVAKLIKAKGRYHTEQNYRAVVEAFDRGAPDRAPSTLAQQVARAQAEMATWSPELRDSVQLEGSSSRRAPSIAPAETGATMANVMFNFAQKAGHTLTSDDTALFDKLRKEWDERRRAPSIDSAADAKDAARYRWLKENVYGGSMGLPNGWIDTGDRTEWDRIIDAALQPEGAA